MTANHHTPHAFEEELTSPLQNAPLGQLDSAITNLLAGALAFSQIRLASPTELTIATGAITVSQTYHTLDTEGEAASDNLDTINGGAAGDLLFVQAVSAARVVTIRHNGGGSGNIRFWDGGNLALDATYKILAFLFDGTTWNYIGTIPTGSGAPSTASYITQVAEAGLSAEQALASLATGIMHVTTTTGVVGSYKTNSTTTDPTTGDDSGDGYSIGSRWINTSTDKEFVALDVSVGAAVWKETTVSASGSLSFAILRDERSTGTNGGGSTGSSWNARTLQTEVYDPDGIVSIASNQFTPISGAYLAMITSVIGVGASAYSHRVRLFNVTGAVSVEEGISLQGSASDRTLGTLKTIFTANGTDAYRIDHYTTVTQATTGQGLAVGDGSNEVYLEILLIKVA